MTSPGPTDPPPSRPEADLCWALGHLARMYATATAGIVSEIPGGQRGYRVLTAAANGLARSQKSLAHEVGVDRSIMTYLIDELENGGLVERRTDPTDRRGRQIVLTEAGRAMWTRTQNALQEHEQKVLENLGGDGGAFRSMLHLLASATPIRT